MAERDARQRSLPPTWGRSGGGVDEKRAGPIEELHSLPPTWGRIGGGVDERIHASARRRPHGSARLFVRGGGGPGFGRALSARVRGRRVLRPRPRDPEVGAGGPHVPLQLS